MRKTITNTVQTREYQKRNQTLNWIKIEIFFQIQFTNYFLLLKGEIVPDKLWRRFSQSWESNKMFRVRISTQWRDFTFTKNIWRTRLATTLQKTLWDWYVITRWALSCSKLINSVFTTRCFVSWFLAIWRNRPIVPFLWARGCITIKRSNISKLIVIWSKGWDLTFLSKLIDFFPCWNF